MLYQTWKQHQVRLWFKGFFFCVCFQEVTGTGSCRCTHRSPGRSRGGCLNRFQTTSRRSETLQDTNTSDAVFYWLVRFKPERRTSINVRSSIINLMAVVDPSQEKTKRLSHVLVVFSFLPHVGHEEPSLFVPSATNLLNKLFPSLTPTFIQICVAWITFYSFQSHVVLKESEY